MYDLDINSDNTVIGAVKVTAAVEPEATAYWRAADHGDPMDGCADRWRVDCAHVPRGQCSWATPQAS